MGDISIKSFCKLLAISVLLLSFVGCSDHKQEDAATFKEGIDAFTKGNYPTALEKFKALADRGNPEGEYNLGVMYIRGYGVSPDPKQTLELWNKAADHGSANAQFNLGIMYRQGKGVPADDKQAVAYWAKAAELGHNMAQMYLGIMYAQGSGIAQDRVQAYKWFYIAADKGNKGAVQNMTTVSLRMEPAQVEQGKKLAQDWLANHAKK